MISNIYIIIHCHLPGIGNTHQFAKATSPHHPRTMPVLHFVWLIIIIQYVYYTGLPPIISTNDDWLTPLVVCTSLALFFSFRLRGRTGPLKYCIHSVGFFLKIWSNWNLPKLWSKGPPDIDGYRIAFAIFVNMNVILLFSIFCIWSVLRTHIYLIIMYIINDMGWLPPSWAIRITLYQA